MMRSHLWAGSLCTLALAAGAQGGTLVTFSDPANGPSTPLFVFSGNQLSGGWTGSGLTLLTPGLLAPDYNNAGFVLNPVLQLVDFGPAALLGSGSIDFFDSASNPLLTISFNSAILTKGLSFGSSDFIGSQVTFSGPILGGESFTNEAFAFSFANPVATEGGFTVTSAFTSSADRVIPSPGAATLALMGGVLAARRRR